MNRKLRTVSVGPKGMPKKLVISLHGYRSSGINFSIVKRLFPEFNTSVDFVFPDAPYECVGYPFGFQWFKTRNYMDPNLIDEMNEVSKRLKTEVQGLLDEYNLTWSDVVLMGFSQGGFMAAHFGLTLPEKVAGIITFSGAHIGVDRFNIQAKPPMCLIHGLSDSIIPALRSVEAAKHFKEQRIEAELHELKGLEHVIDQDAMDIGMGFLKRVFNI